MELRTVFVVKLVSDRPSQKWVSEKKSEENVKKDKNSSYRLKRRPPRNTLSTASFRLVICRAELLLQLLSKHRKSKSFYNDTAAKNNTCIWHDREKQYPFVTKYHNSLFPFRDEYLVIIGDKIKPAWMVKSRKAQNWTLTLDWRNTLEPDLWTFLLEVVLKLILFVCLHRTSPYPVPWSLRDL